MGKRQNVRIVNLQQRPVELHLGDQVTVLSPRGDVVLDALEADTAQMKVLRHEGVLRVVPLPVAPSDSVGPRDGDNAAEQASSARRAKKKRKKSSRAKRSANKSTNGEP